MSCVLQLGRPGTLTQRVVALQLSFAAAPFCYNQQNEIFGSLQHKKPKRNGSLDQRLGFPLLQCMVIHRHRSVPAVACINFAIDFSSCMAGPLYTRR